MTKYKLEDMNKWVEALESGKYNQVKHTLKGKKEDGSVGFCCLGVFCEINGREIKTEPLFESDTGKPYYSFEGGKDHYKFTEDNMPGGMKEEGISMNDGGNSFKEIAEMIKEYIEEYPEKFE